MNHRSNLLRAVHSGDRRPRVSGVVLLIKVLALAGSMAAFPICANSQARAETANAFLRPTGTFAVPTGLKGKVEFWKLIFTKYGDKQLVFHHRDYPEITYSVLDLRELNKSYSGKELVRRSNQAIEDEVARIKETLIYLSEGNEARTPFQRRLEKLFSHLPGRASRNYADAAEQRQIRYQRGVRDQFRQGVIRSGRYLHAMERMFEMAGLPVELTRLPLIESSFDYTAYSSVGAAGIWQFMRQTGKAYMRIDSYVDERRDPIFATRAAAQYLAHAYEVLGAWPLAVTSYNHGINGVLRAAKEVGSTDIVKIIAEYDGSSWGFASKNFFAELLAAIEVERHAEVYFPGIRRESAWHFDEVRIRRPISFKELVRYSGASADDIEKLNRALLRPIVTGRAKIPSGMVVMVPAGRGKRLLASVGAGEIVAFDRASNRPASGSIARSQPLPGASRKRSIARTEDQPETVTPQGRTAEVIGDRPARSSGEQVVGRSYTVVRGDTVFSISRKLGAKPSDIIAANSLENGARLAIGSKLIIPGATSRTERPSGSASTSTAPESPKTRYIVAKGDTLGEIAARFGFSQKQIMAANPRLNAKRLKPGTTVVLPVAPAVDEEDAEEMSERAAKVVRQRARSSSHSAAAASEGRTYQVKSGDTLYSIAKRVGVPLKRLMALNPSAKKGLKPGMTLRLR